MVFRVCHVEDDPVVRRGFSAVLTRHSQDLSLVGSFGTATEALDAIKDGLRFEIAVVDLGLPDTSGLEVIRAVRRTRPDATALAFTIYGDAASIFDALKAGARGYLLKDTPPDRLHAALMEAAQGGAPLSAAVALMMVESFNNPPVAQTGDAEALTSRERDVLELLVRGDAYGTVAKKLGVSLSTIQGHVRSIYAKLEVNSKAEATSVALKRGLVTL